MKKLAIVILCFITTNAFANWNDQQQAYNQNMYQQEELQNQQRMIQNQQNQMQMQQNAQLSQEWESAHRY